MLRCATMVHETNFILQSAHPVNHVITEESVPSVPME